jgi:hypothetical protein
MTSNKYWAFVASLATTLRLAQELSEEGDAVATAAFGTYLRPCASAVREASIKAIRVEEPRVIGQYEVLHRM